MLPLSPQKLAAVRGGANGQEREQAGPRDARWLAYAEAVDGEKNLVEVLHHLSEFLRRHLRPLVGGEELAFVGEGRRNVAGAAASDHFAWFLKEKEDRNFGVFVRCRGFSVRKFKYKIINFNRNKNKFNLKQFI